MNHGDLQPHAPVQSAPPRRRPALARRCQTPVRHCVILAGGLTASPLVRVSGHSVLDFQITPRRTLLEQWLYSLELARPFVSREASMVLACSPGCVPPPALKLAEGATSLQVEHVFDHSAYRGPAGTLRDACVEGDPDDVILVAEAARCFEGGIDRFIDSHLQAKAAVSVGVNPDGTPAGLYLIQRGLLDSISQRGFVDLKEQWLPRLVSRGVRVCVERVGLYPAEPLRDRASLIRTAARAMGWTRERERRMGPFAASTRRSSAISSVIAVDAQVDPTATIVDSIICRGAVVERGAILAHTIVCPGAHVQADQTLTRTVVSAKTVRVRPTDDGFGGKG